MCDATGFSEQVHGIIDDPATSDALRAYSISAAKRDLVDVLAELEVIWSLFQERVNVLLPSVEH